MVTNLEHVQKKKKDGLSLKQLDGVDGIAAESCRELVASDHL